MRSAWTARRMRVWPRITESGAGAGPQTCTPFALGADAASISPASCTCSSLRPERMIAARRPKGGKPARFALAPFGGVEGVAVAGGDRLQHHVVGFARLDQHAAGPVGAAGAARDLMQQLKRALARARVGAFQP